MAHLKLKETPKGLIVKQTMNAIFAIGDGKTMVARYTAGEWRVNIKGGSEAGAYYTNDADDALGTAKLMYARGDF